MGLSSGDIIILNEVTGTCISVLSGHADKVSSLDFSTDGAMLVSGSNDKTVKLWDIQTGGVIKTYYSHTNSQLLISASGDAIAFSSDRTHFVSWWGSFATVWKSDSGVAVAKLNIPFNSFHCCCFSPNGRSIAGAVGDRIYIWDITGPDPCLVETFAHTGNITSIAFSSSSLISASQNRLVKFWQISSLSMDVVERDRTPTPPTSISIQSVNLQAGDGIAISSDSDGVVRTWNISTGFCEALFQTPAKGRTWRDARMIDGKLIFIWFADERVHIWDTKKGELLQQVDALFTNRFWDLRISGDGSKVFFADGSIIQAWSIWTGEVMGEVRLEGKLSSQSLAMDGSRIWVHTQGSLPQGWDFGAPGSPPIPLSNISPDQPHLELFDGTK